MSQTWMTVMEAAEAMGVRPATLRYMIIAGEVVSRFGANGREVLVGVPGPGEEAMGMETPRRRLGWVTAAGWGTAVVLSVIVGAYAMQPSKGASEKEATPEEATVQPTSAGSMKSIGPQSGTSEADTAS